MYKRLDISLRWRIQHEFSSFLLNEDWPLFVPSNSVISFPFSLHQAIKDNENDITVIDADTKNVPPIQRVSPAPGTGDVTAHKEA